MAQDFAQRGFLDTRLVLYPQKSADDKGRVVAESWLRYEASRLLLPGLRLHGALDARTDSHRQVEREPHIDFTDRTLRRPALSVRRLSLVYNRGKVTAEAGKQLIRWGKADVLNPTDRFAPRDFLSVVDNDFLPVTAARVTYESGANTIEAVWQPLFTPSRTPLLNQRWTVLPPEAAGIALRDGGSRYPEGSQFGVRLGHIGKRYEGSVSFFDGFNHLPLLDGRFDPSSRSVQVQRFYPTLRMFGADTAVPLHWFTVKGEAAWFTTRTAQADEYLLYVIQLERQSGEWSFVGGYAGQAVTDQRSRIDFSPDRGLTRAFLGRASYTIDASRSVAVDTAIRQNGGGVWLRFEYSQLLGQHWRATTGFTLIRGEPDDFLGQYRRNSHAILALRYSL
ncbi:MAG TPA: hypothetical protein VMZ52_11115 [Bryobacteraceae bacterium]|nr:hypothetical protein [Bryobacteraceae bacterium]